MKSNLNSPKDGIGADKSSNIKPVNHHDTQQLNPIEKNMNAALDKLYGKPETQNKSSHENYVSRAELEKTLKIYRSYYIQMMYGKDLLSPGMYRGKYAIPETEIYVNTRFLFDFQLLIGRVPDWSIVIHWVGDAKRIMPLESLVYEEFDASELLAKFVKLLQVNLDKLKIEVTPSSSTETEAQNQGGDILLKFNWPEGFFTPEEMELIKNLQRILFSNLEQTKILFIKDESFMVDVHDSVIGTIEGSHNWWVTYAQTIVKLYSFFYESEPEVAKLRYFSFLVERIAFLKIYHRYYSQKGTEARCLVGAPTGLSEMYDCSRPYNY